MHRHQEGWGLGWQAVCSRRYRRRTVTWKKAVLVGLVVLLVLAGVSLLMPGMASLCPECGPATAGACVLVVVLVVASLEATTITEEIRRRCRDLQDLLRATSLDPPPRLA